MASNFPNVILGPESVVYETGTESLYPVGQKLVTPSGSIFRYTKLGELGVANKLYQSEVPKTNWITQAATTALVVGDTTIAFTDGGTSYGANDFVGGTLLAEETADLGHIYPIASHPLSSGSAEVIFTLVKGVTVQNAVAVIADNVLTLLKNPWKDVIIHPAVPTAMVVGIPRIVIASGAYGWMQTRGVASCVIDSNTDALVLGTAASPSSVVTGGVELMQEAAGVVDKGIVGWCMETAPDLDFGTLFLTLE